MKKFFKLFCIRREERLAALIALLYTVALNGMVIAKYYDLFSQSGKGRWLLFVKNFLISGFDPITYSVITGWGANYNVYRHPFLAFMVWPMSVIDGWLEDAFGINFAQFLAAVPLVFCSFYAFIFLLRIFTDILKLKRYDALMLSSMLFSFAYIMITVSVPDHFCASMFLLLFTIYLSGRKMLQGGHFTIVQTWLLFFVTAGVTLSNGIKTFLYALFTNWRKFFRVKYIVFAVLVPSLLIWVFARWEYRTYVLPGEKARKEAKVRKQTEKQQKAFIAFMDSTSFKDTTEATKAFNAMMKKRIVAKYKADHKQPWNKHTGKPMGNGEFMRWTDKSTSRWETAVENLFGETIQLHRDHLLEDTLRSRPVIVKYRWALSYVVEGLIVALFLIGVWSGRRSRFMWMVLAGFMFDMALHMGLGFGINEVYIMGAHWLFALPIAMGYLMRRQMGRTVRIALRTLITVLVAYLFIYNAVIYTAYLL